MSRRSGRAIVLAAGRGSRLKRYTDSLPKCLLPFLGQTLLDRQIATLRACGITEIGLVRGYRPNAFDGRDLRIWTNERWQGTNMAYSLFCASEALREQTPLIISYGDIVYSTAVLRTLVETPGNIVVAVDQNWRKLWEARSDDPLKDAETLRLGPGQTIVDIGRKPSSLDEIEAQYIGLMYFTVEGLKRLREVYEQAAHNPEWLMGRPRERCYMTDLLRGLIAIGSPPKAAVIRGGWLEFDTDSDLELYTRLASEGSLSTFYSPGEN